MKLRYNFGFFLLGLILISCDTPFNPKPSEDEDIFKVSHDFKGGPRIVHNMPITLTWSEVTIEDFSSYQIYRSVLQDGEELWEQRAEITNPLQVSYTDTLDDDVTFRYKVRIEDASGNFREAKTEQLVFQTSHIIVPDEIDHLQQAYETPFIDSGDTIYVSAGTYNYTLVAIGKNVAIISVAGKEETILERGGTIVSMNRGVISGFTFISGGVNLFGTALMKDCIITGVHTFGFYAPVVVSDTAEVQDCLISGNKKTNYYGVGGDGAGMVVRDYATVRNCRISRNKTRESGGGISVYGEPTIMNCIIDNNYAEKGGGGLFINMFSKPTIVNSVIYKNRSGLTYGKYGALLGERGTYIFLNNIVWRNSGHGGESIIWRGAAYCDIQGYSGGTGNINTDPQFVDSKSGDFHLLPGSPCIDAGHPGDEYRDVDGTRNDMGAYGGPYGE